MKNLWNIVAAVLLIFIVNACRKTGFIESPDAFLTTSQDTLHFDTVFTSTGSITQSFKIFNHNDQKLRLSSVQLMGGSNSPFRMNVDGTASTSVRNIEVAPNDSIYVFVTVTINPNAADLPFIVQDSIQIIFNGNTRFVQLDAFGQNANFYRNRRITRDSTWNNDLPFVILGGVTVDSSVTLTINKGCRIYHHADAPFIVRGSLKVMGEKEDSLRVRFQGDRLDQYYRDFPGSWPGIYFLSSSQDNVLNYAIIKNAYQGIISELPARNNQPKVRLNQTIIDNIYDVGILGIATTIDATNCLISNCGNNIGITAGGSYNFTHCTVASIGNSYIQHRNPVLFISNAVSQTLTNPVAANFTNCIIYGEGGIVENEIVLDSKGTTAPFNVTFTNVLYKQKEDPAIPGVIFSNSLRNESPRFDSINVGNRIFNFRLAAQSPAINIGVNTSTLIDLDGKTRTGIPDIGCYEH
ncbi:choice-of-anchor Q domain-containing protein [Aridibaculum aurantiacum]|uniref:choice-of-anchor Q domain-containing protein n=1 Tax=Aridibaculum aurantiacum TaxID=2810307 RepID=UPI001A96BB43|nr:choice-of-anchor Q domain-containing protein [Aridibaculum aurantiacum]